AGALPRLRRSRADRDRGRTRPSQYKPREQAPRRWLRDGCGSGALRSWSRRMTARRTVERVRSNGAGIADAANAAVRAEPGGIGTAGARDPLRREVKLLGSLLGQVIAEQSGPDLLDLVERIRRKTIAI